MTEIHSCSYFCNRPECIKAQRDELRDRLMRPEQEPVGEMFLIDEATVELALEALHNVTEDYVENRQRTHNRAIEQLYKVFVPAPQRKPLTSEEVSDLRIKHGITSNGRGIKEFTQIVDFVRDIEARLKEKNI